MYEAKRTQSRVSVYRSDSDSNDRERLALIDALRDAIESRALSVHYQPTLDMRAARSTAWKPSSDGTTPPSGCSIPDSFIPLAEHNGLMPQITRAVLEMAVAEAAHLDRAGYRLGMSVNISRHDLVDEDLADYVDAVLAGHGFPP